MNPSVAPDESDTDVVSLLKRMQQQLTFLERKIDQLINQSQERQPSRERSSSDRSFKRPFSKPFRSFEHPQRQGKGEYGRPRDRDSAQGHFYEHRPGKKGRGPGRKPSSFKRKDQE